MVCTHLLTHTRHWSLVIYNFPISVLTSKEKMINMFVSPKAICCQIVLRLTDFQWYKLLLGAVPALASSCPFCMSCKLCLSVQLFFYRKE